MLDNIKKLLLKTNLRHIRNKKNNDQIYNKLLTDNELKAAINNKRRQFIQKLTFK